MSVILKEVKNKRDLKLFIQLPKQIHKNHNNWVPPIYREEWKFYNPKYNRQLRDSDVILFLAIKENRIAGRIMGIIQNKYNKLHDIKTARFFNLDSYDDSEVVRSLLLSVEQWSEEKGMSQIIGPFGFSDKDPQGMQIEGFNHIAVISTANNLPYLPKFVEDYGYEKEIDCLVYTLDIPKQIPEIYKRIYERLKKNCKYRLLEFNSRRDLKPFVVPVLRLVNDTYKSIYGFIPMDEEEMRNLAKRYLPMLDPAFTKVIVDDANDPIAFVIASPDISVGIIKAKGKLFPYGFISILQSAKKSRQLDLLLGAVKPQYKNLGLTAFLGVKIFQTALKRGMKSIDSHLILETNKPMRDVMEHLGATVYKRYRIYRKELNNLSYKIQHENLKKVSQIHR